MTGDEYEKPEVEVLGSVDDLDGQIGEPPEDYDSVLPPADEPPEAGCNCRHLPFGATCIYCSERLEATMPTTPTVDVDGAELVTDGRGSE